MGNQVSGFIFNEKLGFPIITDFHDDYHKLHENKDNKFLAVTIQRAKTLVEQFLINGKLISILK
jgi:hypothetical protein